MINQMNSPKGPEIIKPQEKITVLLSKRAFQQGSRNPIRPIFRAAGLDFVADAKYDRNDEVTENMGVPTGETTIEDGDFRFRLIKGADRLASQMLLYRNRTIGIIMPGDNIAEALARGMNQELFEPRARRILKLGIGRCSLKFLAPEEKKIASVSDLNGRTVFCKYPNLARQVLERLGVQAQVFETEGADTSISDFREENMLRTAALEIVGSGDTARANRLQIVEDVKPVFLDFDFNDVTTDFWINRMEGMSSYVRGALLALGIGLEGGLEENTNAIITFHIPVDCLPDFEEFGQKGPTISKVSSRDDNNKVYSCEIAVDNRNAPAVMAQLMQMGATDVYVSNNEAPAGRRMEDSQVFKNLGLAHGDQRSLFEDEES